ncbi:MAG: hypothetical protein ACRD96_07460, partial [Bryobacteraceae bacterium]
AQDSSQKTWVVERILTGAHLVQRGNYRLQISWDDGFQVVTPGAPRSWSRPVTFRIPSNPSWNGIRAHQGLDEQYVGNGIYQSHPSYENHRAAEPGRGNFFVDVMPFVASPSITSSLSAVDGFARVYKASGVRLRGRGLFPTFALCGGRQLKEISPGPIADRDSHTFCIGSQCVPGAASTDAFVNCPGPVSTSSHCATSDAGVCLGELPPFGQAVSQFYLHPSGTRARVLTNGLAAWESPRTGRSLDTAFALPDGRWVVFIGHGSNSRRDLYMIKVPAEPDEIPPAQFYSPTLEVSSSAPQNPEIVEAVIEYGPTHALGASVRVNCRAGNSCKAVIPGRPADLLYSKVTFRDRSGRVVAEDPVQIRVTGGPSGAPVPKSPAIASNGVRNSASLDARFAPGGLATVSGEFLANCEQRAASFPLPFSLCGASVEF